MTLELFKQNAHLYLGLTRKEFARRMSLGIIDIEILHSQIEQNSKELKREVLCEKCIESNSLDQVDKFSSEVDSPL